MQSPLLAQPPIEHSQAQLEDLADRLIVGACLVRVPSRKPNSDDAHHSSASLFAIARYGRSRSTMTGRGGHDQGLSLLCRAIRSM